MIVFLSCLIQILYTFTSFRASTSGVLLPIYVQLRSSIVWLTQSMHCLLIFRVKFASISLVKWVTVPLVFWGGFLELLRAPITISSTQVSISYPSLYSSSSEFLSLVVDNYEKLTDRLNIFINKLLVDSSHIANILTHQVSPSCCSPMDVINRCLLLVAAPCCKASLLSTLNLPVGSQNMGLVISYTGRVYRSSLMVVIIVTLV